MLATGSSRTDRVLLTSWALSACVNVVLMWKMPGAETIPFHLVWIGLAIIYGYTTWRIPGMSLTLGLVAVATGYILVHHARVGWIGWEETTEVPLMSALFVVMVWHVRRRQVALAELSALAAADRRRAEAQQLFIRFASHELRTPITIARGYTELISAAAPGVAEDSAVVIDELDKLARITERLVTLMQLEGGAVRTPGDVDCELVRIVHRWEPTADRKWVINSHVGQAMINAERLAAAVDSLVENAVKFTADGDRIEVTGTRTASTWSVAVRDNGCGIAEEDLGALSAGGPLPAASVSGTGLGLAIARAVAASWGGELLITSAPGAGTTVELRMPAAGVQALRDGEVRAGSLFSTGLADAATARSSQARPA